MSFPLRSSQRFEQSKLFTLRNRPYSLIQEIIPPQKITSLQIITNYWTITLINCPNCQAANSIFILIKFVFFMWTNWAPTSNAIAIRGTCVMSKSGANKWEHTSDSITITLLYSNSAYLARKKVVKEENIYPNFGVRWLVKEVKLGDNPRIPSASLRLMKSCELHPNIIPWNFRSNLRLSDLIVTVSVAQ